MMTFKFLTLFVQSCVMLRQDLHLKLAGFSRRHGCILKGALKRPLSTDLHEISPPVSASLPNNIHPFNISFRNQDGPLEKHCHITSSLLIQRSSPRRNKDVFASVISNNFHLMSPSNYRMLSFLRPFSMTINGLTRKT